MCSDIPSQDGTTNCNLSLREGESQVLLEVHDINGAIGGDAVTLEVIPDEHPDVSITSPFDGDMYYADDAIVVAGVVSDAEDDVDTLVVRWNSTIDGDLPLSPVADSLGEVGGIIQLSEGYHTLQLSAEDRLGNQGIDQISLTVRAANTAPSCQIDHPLTGAVLEAGVPVLFEGVVSDPDQAASTLTVSWASDVDGVLGASVANSTGHVAIQEALSAGSHLVTLQAVDERGVLCSDFVLLSVSAPPTVTLLSPASGAVVDVGSALLIEAEVSDGEDSPDALALEWASSLDGLLSTQSASSTGQASVTASLSQGVHTISVTAVDTDGMQASDTVSIHVNGLPSQPVVSLSPSPAATTDDLVAVIDVDSIDPEGSPVSYGYRWTKDGQAQSLLVSATVPASATKVGEDWEVTVTPSDGVSSGTPGVAMVTIEGTDTGTPPVDTGDTGDTGSPTDTGATVPPIGNYTHCTQPAVYSRLTHSEGNVDFRVVAYEPHGEYALILGYPSELYRYDPTTQDLSHLASGGNDYWETIAFAPDGSYALIGGADAATSPDPVLYVYTEAAGLNPITGVTSGGLYSPSRISSIAHRPGTDSFAILSDNTGSWPSQITYIHEFTPDFSTGTHTWLYGGGQVSSQGSSSVAWGMNNGQQIALAADRYLELFYYDPSLSSGNFSTLSTNTGNLKKVVFNVDGSVAWVLQWSGSGKVYTWEGSLRTDYYNTYTFSGYTIWDFATSPDGYWKVFVGRFGNIYWSNSDWRPIDHAAFTNQPIANFDQPPYSATSNDYLHSVAWRPDSCDGLIVGDATSSQGTLILFELQ